MTAAARSARRGVAALVAAAGIAAAQEPAPRMPCGTQDKACAFRELARHPAKSIAFWRDAMSRPLEERIAAGPSQLVEFLTLDVIVNGFPNRPRLSNLEDGLLADTRAAFADLPEAVKRRLPARLAGVYFVDDIGGTGFTDATRDESGRPVAAFIVLDPAVLRKRRANDWATWKESSPFKPDARWALKATIEDPADDSRRQAIQYILLHELGHVLAASERVHPDWNLAPANVPALEYPFFDLSWRIDRSANRYVTRFDADFPERGDVRFYFGPRLPGDAMARVYDRLSHTSFPTLYAATHPGDDFAESFANYVHTVMMRKPFEIEITQEGRVVKRYAACWDETRCADKRRFIEGLLR